MQEFRRKGFEARFRHETPFSYILTPDSFLLTPVFLSLKDKTEVGGVHYLSSVGVGIVTDKAADVGVEVEV